MRRGRCATSRSQKARSAASVSERLKAGDDLLVFNGRHGEWRASVAEVLKKGVVLRAEEQVRAMMQAVPLP